MRARLCFFLCLFGVTAGLPAIGRAQAIEGKVELPKPTPAAMAPQRYQISPEMKASGTGESPGAVVFLEGDFPVPRDPPNHRMVEMSQKNISFSPGLLAVQIGTSVEFPNLDDTYHNVFSYSKTKRFDLGRYRKGEKPGVVRFDQPGVVSLHCEIHGDMRGTILVLATPYFQKTDARGAFRMTRLPVGKYLLKAWVSEDDVRVRAVEVKPGETLHVDFPAK